MLDFPEMVSAIAYPTNDPSAASPQIIQSGTIIPFSGSRQHPNEAPASLNCPLPGTYHVAVYPSMTEEQFGRDYHRLARSVQGNMRSP